MSAFRPPDGAPRPPGARVRPGLTPAPMRGPDAAEPSGVSHLPTTNRRP